MTCEQLINAVGSMDDAYILEYDELSYDKVLDFRSLRRYMKVLAACFVLIFTVFAAFIISAHNLSADTATSQGSTNMGPNQGDIEYFGISQYDGYLEFLEEAKPKVKPDLIRFSAFDVLGEFDYFLWWGAWEADYSAYYYSLTDPNGVEHSIYIYRADKESEFKYTLMDSLPTGMSSMCDLGQAYDFSPAYERNGLQYCYLRDGELSMLRWEENGFFFHLSGGWDKYRENAQGDTLIQRLLSMDDAVAAAAAKELKENIKASREAAQWDYIWYHILTWMQAISALLLVVAMALWNHAASKRYAKKHGKKRPFSAKRFLSWLAVILICIILLLMTIDIHILPGLDNYFHQKIGFRTHRIFLPGLPELWQLEEGMPIDAVMDILGNPQRSASGNTIWDLYFGCTLKVDFDAQQLSSWEITGPMFPAEANGMPNGWYAPGILLIFGILSFCVYNIIISGKKGSKRRCIAWMTAVLVFVFVLLLLVDVFVLPHYTVDGRGHPKIFHLQALNFGKITKDVNLWRIETILGPCQRAPWGEKGYKYQWDLPFGGVFWVEPRVMEDPKMGVEWFASVSGFVVPGIMLITIISELLAYGIWFHPQWFRNLRYRRKTTAAKTQ